MSEQQLSKDRDRLGKRVHVALPIRIRYPAGSRTVAELACTYDIHPRGARVASLRTTHAGDLVTVERGKNKALCRVVWAGDPNSALCGQFEIECIETDKLLWTEELQGMEELYDRIGTDRNPSRARNFSPSEDNRRRGQRFAVQGLADLIQIPASASVEADLKEISEFGCLVSTSGVLLTGTDLKLVLNITHCDVTVKGQVRHAARGPGVGIEFYEIRRGDRPLLRYLLRKLAVESGDVPTIELVDIPL